MKCLQGFSLGVCDKTSMHAGNFFFCWRVNRTKISTCSCRPKTVPTTLVRKPKIVKAGIGRSAKVVLVTSARIIHSKRVDTWSARRPAFDQFGKLSRGLRAHEGELFAPHFLQGNEHGHDRVDLRHPHGESEMRWSCCDAQGTALIARFEPPGLCSRGRWELTPKQRRGGDQS